MSDGTATGVQHADCQLVVTETRHRHLLEGPDLGLGPGAILDIDSPDWGESLRSADGAGVPHTARFGTGDPRANPGRHAEAHRLERALSHVRRG